MKTVIKQINRATARKTVNTLKQAGKVAKLIDNGSKFTGADRWAVEVEGRNVLQAPCKPTNKPFSSLKEKTCTKLKKGTNHVVAVPVFYKKNRR